MTVEQGIAEARDQFPIGMRVLAVDDDPTCLKLLETLLRRCQYHVTATSQAITALRMLREHRNKFDLVISDVHMPDMDGFKLLELVGLEMDLPVIMLSANSDPKSVMKGITHGACDYLLKPVRIEELKNIWQHVIRRKKFDNKDRNNVDNRDKPHPGSGEATSDQKLNKKRKDQNEDEDEDREENGNENEDPTTQKKPRVVWSVELHRKFVLAVNQLGIDKAVPKKILDLMNVEKLTRENVASHLQKYRLYLKRISTVANQQANMVAALSGTDTSYLQMSSMNGLGFHNLAGPGQLHNTAFRSIPPGGMLGRLNSPTSLGMHGLTSSGVIQLGHVQPGGHVANSQTHFQQVLHPGNNGKILPGMPMSLELDQMHSNKAATYNTELPTDTPGFSAFGGFSDAKMIVGSSNSSSFGVSNKPLMLEGCHKGAQDCQNYGKQSSVTVSSLDDAFSSHFVNHGRVDESWSSSVPSTGVHPNSLSDHFKQASLCPGNIRNGTSTTALQSGRKLSDVSSISTLPVHLQDSKPDLQFSRNNNSLQGLEDHRQDALYHSNAVCSSLNYAIPIDGIGSPMGQSWDPNSTIFQSTTSFSSTRQSNFGDPSLMKHNEVESSVMESLLWSNEGSRTGHQKLQDKYVFNSFASLEDLVSGMVKQVWHRLHRWIFTLTPCFEMQEQLYEPDKVKLTDEDFGCGTFSLRTCM